MLEIESWSGSGGKGLKDHLVPTPPPWQLTLISSDFSKRIHSVTCVNCVLHSVLLNHPLGAPSGTGRGLEVSLKTFLFQAVHPQLSQSSYKRRSSISSFPKGYFPSLFPCLPVLLFSTPNTRVTSSCLNQIPVSSIQCNLLF